MKYLVILTLLILSCGGNDNSASKKTVKQIYDDCYKVSDNMFKNIPESEYKTLVVDNLCDNDTSFHEEKLEIACNQACKDAFYLYKNKAESSL